MAQLTWFRYYHDALDNLKVQQLPPVTFKHWVNLLCLANQGTPRGQLPETSVIAFRLRLPEPKAAALMEDLVARRLIDYDADGNAVPHDWPTRQAKSDNVTERVEKHRRNVTRNVTETVSGNVTSNGVVTPRARKDTDTDTDTDTDIPPNPPDGGQLPAPRESRIPTDFEIDDDMIAWAEAKGFSRPQIDHHTEAFCAFWQAKPGKDAKKLDWRKTWQVWLGKEQPGKWPGGFHANGRASPNGSYCPHPFGSHAAEDWERMHAGLEPAWGSAQGGIDKL